MVYRIHFTSQDLARTRPAGPMPFAELLAAARALQDRSRAARLDPWRRSVLGRLPERARMALSLAPADGWGPTFLMPAVAGRPEELLERVRATPGRLVAAELAAIAEHQPVPGWARRLAEDGALREELAQSLGLLYEHLVGRYWSRITDCYAADRAVRMRQFLGGGVELLLAGASPRWMRWKPPVLEVRSRVDHDLRLQGQGVLLAPSVFAKRAMVSDDSHGLPQPAVTFPIDDGRPAGWPDLLGPDPAPAGSGPTVTALLGRTRAAVLRVIADHPGCSTKELAVLAGITPSSASEHATVLREARLIGTSRYRNTALHSPTALGLGLLGDGPDVPDVPGSYGS
ncbi:ArsR family transcriptional regulator [Kitasatospora xanthocidica]|uniref:ArsR family transcriptional regulator n=2 Tax=Kitasatospora TaxID=2063 RepID=A0A372ZPE4_9ACTN|nr:winged helix-turn-helix domain-containing protein [Kitasatospora xanthocidica]RGD57115.1 ArsR family transcriptional regulator [Kitasatospora xanthocidica]